MSDGALWDRLRASFAALVRAMTQQHDYDASYTVTVKSQASDGTLGVVFDDSRFAPADGVPYRLGIPGTTVKVSPGARGLVGFENQDPGKPRLLQWENNNMLELHVDPSVATVFNGGTANVGRVGDLVAANTTMAQWITQVTGVCNGIVPLSVTAPGDFGKISSGTTKVKA